jgi:FkbM family methyltransferase
LIPSSKFSGLIFWLRKVRIALTPTSWLLKTRLSNGAVVFGRNQRGYGGRGIYVFRDALEPELEHLLQFLDPTDVLVDVGANTGIFTMKAGKYLAEGGGEVIALEPFPEMLAMLEHNVRANGLNNVRLRNVCAGDHTYAADFWRNFDRPHAFSLVKHDDRATSFSTLVVALDDLLAWEGIKRLNYLKIDAEGAEAQIIAGAEKTIHRHRPIILMEINLVDAKTQLPDYASFQVAPKCVNRLLIPNESPKKALAERLGWKCVNLT